MGDTLLEVRHLHTCFHGKSGVVQAVDDLSYTVDRGQCVAIIGESGSGKSVSALSIMRLVPYPPGLIEKGEVLFEGVDLLKLPDGDMQSIRGREISMIFQEPSAALNPVMTIGDQIAENILIHEKISKHEALARAEDLLKKVDIPNPGVRLKDYPHNFSGGMQQRAMIAMAMSLGPKLLIADEPTTALDVTVQAQVLEQLNLLRSELGTSLIIITHNLGIVARYADNVKIMYGGRILEEGPTEDIFDFPSHPYTLGLIRAVPRLDLEETPELYTIDGEPPDLAKLDRKACPFAARCKYVQDRCNRERPELEDVSDGHRSACFFKSELTEEREALML